MLRTDGKHDASDRTPELSARWRRRMTKQYRAPTPDRLPPVRSLHVRPLHVRPLHVQPASIRRAPQHPAAAAGRTACQATARASHLGPTSTAREGAGTGRATWKVQCGLPAPTPTIWTPTATVSGASHRVPSPDSIPTGPLVAGPKQGPDCDRPAERRIALFHGRRSRGPGLLAAGAKVDNGGALPRATRTSRSGLGHPPGHASPDRAGPGSELGRVQAESKARQGTRTLNRLITNQVLCQLS